MIYDDAVIAVKTITYDKDINNNYNIYINRTAKDIQMVRWRWSCKGASTNDSVTGRRAVPYKMVVSNSCSHGHNS